VSESPRGGLVVGGLVLVVAIVLVAYLARSEGGRGEAPPAPVVGAERSAPEAAPAFTPVPPPPVESLVPAGTGARPIADSGAAPDGGPPVVARGTVTFQGGPLPEGAEADVVLFDNEGTDLETVTAAADGSFEIRWDEPLSPGWSVGTDLVTLVLGAEVVDLLPDNSGPLAAHLPKEPPVQVPLELGHAPLVVGRVYDRLTGENIVGAEITAISSLAAYSFDECYELSGDDGRYELPLEDLSLRGLIVWCRADGWQAQAWGPQDVPPAAAPGEALRVDFALDATVPWRGRVLSAIDGLPVDGATITIGHDQDGLNAWSDFEISDEDGTWELELGDVPVEGAWVHVQQFDYAPVAVRNVRPGEDIVVRLPAPVSVAGRVVTRGGGEPVDSATVAFYFDGETLLGENGLYDEAYTDADGAFELVLEYAPADMALIRVDSTDHAHAELPFAAVARPAGAGRWDMVIELEPLDG
jgi:hypothetical protein